MKLRNYLNHLIGKTDALKPAKISWSNIKAVFQAKKRSIAGFILEDYIYEQIIWRRVEVRNNSPRCWYSGNCKVCGCDILGKTMEDRACSISEHPDLLEKRKPCYPAMMNEKEWKQHKLINKIKLFN